MAKCLLPGCNNKARVKFCCNTHKDKYHNRVRREERQQRIADEMTQGVRDYEDLYENDFHPFDSYSLGQD